MAKVEHGGGRHIIKTENQDYKTQTKQEIRLNLMNHRKHDHANKERQLYKIKRNNNKLKSEPTIKNDIYMNTTTQ